jgi:hypothetical protein
MPPRKKPTVPKRLKTKKTANTANTSDDYVHFKYVGDVLVQKPRYLSEEDRQRLDALIGVHNGTEAFKFVRKLLQCQRSKHRSIKDS